jgi:hypothetical protein
LAVVESLPNNYIEACGEKEARDPKDCSICEILI